MMGNSPGAEGGLRMEPQQSTTLAELAGQASRFVQELRETGEPVVVAVEGGAELIVQDAAAYRRLLDEVEEARAVEGIRRGLADCAAGRTMSLDAFREHVRRRHGLPV